MANSNDFLYKTGPQPAGPMSFGDPEAVALFGMRNELLRRAALAEAQRQQAAAEARQKEQDELARRQAESQMKVAEEQAVSAKALREAQAAERQEKANLAIRMTRGAGATLTPEDATRIKAAGGEVTESPTTTNIPSQFAEAPAVAENPVLTNVGTTDQQTEKRQLDFATQIYNTLSAKAQSGAALSGEEKTWLTQAQSVLMTGKTATLPAGIANPKADTETSTERQAMMERREARLIDAGLDPQKGVDEGIKRGLLSKEEGSELKAWQQRKATESQKLGDKIVVLDRRNEQQNARAVTADVRRERSKFNADLAKDEQLIGSKAESAAQLIMDADAAGVNDATLMTRFIQMKVGGYGSGLRLSDFETQLVGKTMSWLERAVVALKSTGLVPDPDTGKMVRPELVSARMREEMKKASKAILDGARDRIEEIEEARDLAYGPDADAASIAKTRSRYERGTIRLFEKMAGEKKPAEAPGPATALPPGVTVRRKVAQ